MIRYALECEKEHRFEGWFRSSADFDAQSSRGLVACPVCGSVTVSKSLMAPAVQGVDRSGPRPEAGAEAAPPKPATEGEAPAPAAEVLPPEPVDPRAVAMRDMLRQLKEHVVKTSEDVGDKFAEEARKIHYQETEHRSIRGKATPEEARELAEEGIAFSPLPVFPEDLS
jgi:hypothetical protein